MKTILTSTSKETGTVEVGYIEDGHYHLEPIIETKDYKIVLAYFVKGRYNVMFNYNILRPTGGIGEMGNDRNKEYFDKIVGMQ